jgi:periplasmic divalent cation tolerance protein
MSPEPALIVVLTALPDRPSAERLARTLVENALAACVTLLPAGQSFYRWNDRLESTEEILLLIKTQAARYAELEVALRSQHPYELPEILALPVSAGLPAYLDWVRRATEGPCAVC